MAIASKVLRVNDRSYISPACALVIHCCCYWTEASTSVMYMELIVTAAS